MKQISLLFTNSYVIIYQSLVKTNGLNEKSSKNGMERVNKKLSFVYLYYKFLLE